MVIDFRLRPPYGGFLQASMYFRPDRSAHMASALRLPPAACLTEPSLDRTFAEMDAAEVSLGVVPVRRGSGALGDVSNEEVAAVVRKSAGRLIGFGAPNLQDIPEGLADVATIARSPEFAGVVVEPGLWRNPLYGDDRRLYPIYQACVDAELPLIIMGGGNAGPDVSYTSPTIIDHICAEFPTLVVVAAHGGWPWVFETLHVAFRRPNLYLSPDMYLFGMPGWQSYVDAATGFLADRLLFATAYPFVELNAGMSAFKKMFGDEHHERLMSTNAKRVLGSRVNFEGVR